MFTAVTESEQDEVMKLVSALKTEKMVSSDQFMEVWPSPVLFHVDCHLVNLSNKMVQHQHRVI